MLTGKCPLCLQTTKEIVSSHLIPAAIYKRLRRENSEPVRITSRHAVQTSQQIQCPLLCLDCEHMLNRGGEDWLLPLLPTADGTFPLYDILFKSPPYGPVGDAKLKLYAASRTPEIEVEQLAHFAMGVFWKASVHSWGIVQPRESLIDFGSKYREPIRKYLRREASFPQKAALLIAVLPPHAAKIGFVTPVLKSKEKYHLYAFFVQGIQFTLLVGNSVSKEEKEVCFVSNPVHPVLVGDFSHDIFNNVLVPMWARAKKSRNLNKHFERLRNQ
jgi:hypothetical protein